MRRSSRFSAMLATAFLALFLSQGTAYAQSLPDSAFDAATNTELRKLLAQSYGDGLPEAPLRNRILQGAARHVDGARVVALVRAHADSMRAARAALGARASADELDAGASALHAGASRAALHRLRTVRAEGSATTAIIVLTDLLWRGVSSNDAADAIARLASRSNDKALLSLQGAVAREGAPASPQRLQSLVDRFAAPASDKAPSAGVPGRRPVPPDTLPAQGISVTSASSGSPAAGASLALSSLGAPTGGSGSALLGEGEWAFQLGRSWSVAPASALRLAEDGARWSAAISLARQLQPAPNLGARLWVNGEIRSPIARTRSELPVSPDLGASTIPPGRGRDLAIRAGTDLQRRVGAWGVTGHVALGHLRFSSLETTLVPREVPIVPDTQTPRPDTLETRIVLEPQNVWRVLGISTVQGGMSLQRGAYRLNGTIVRRLPPANRSGDSLSSNRRTLFIVGGERRMTSRVAVVGEWSSHDPSLVTGSMSLHDARWRLGFRIASPPPSIVALAPPRHADNSEASRVPSVELRVDSALSGDRDGTRFVRLRVRIPGARAVQVEGDLTGWSATLLAAERDGSFSGTFVVAGPIVRLRVRADGGPWTTPPGLPTQQDDFGDLVGVYVLPG